MAVNKKAPVRKQTTKSRSNVGGSSLGKKTTLFSKRNGLIVAGLAAIVGLVFVAFSFASGPSMGAYQYSVNNCKLLRANGTTGKVLPQTELTQNCINKSAESAVYRTYIGVLGRTPDISGYQYWTQKLAGDKVASTVVIRSFLSSSQVKNKLKPLKTNEELVAYLAKNFQGKTTLTSYDKYWLKRLDNKKKTRSEVIRQYVFAKETASYQQAGFSRFLEDAPRVSVVVYAKKGEYANPTATPTCEAGYSLNSTKLKETSRYVGGAVSSYACLRLAKSAPDLDKNGEARKVTPELVCPTGYKSTAVRGSGTAFYDPTTGNYAPSSANRACKKS